MSICFGALKHSGGTLIHIKNIARSLPNLSYSTNAVDFR